MPHIGYQFQASGYLLSAQAAQAAGAALDNRGGGNYASVGWQVSGNSAVLSLQGGPDGVCWGTIVTWTATVGTTGVHALSGFYPYVRCVADKIASGSNLTAAATVYYYGATR